MDPVSNSDRLVRLLRQQLVERSRAKSTRKSQKGKPAQNEGVDRLSAIAGEVVKAGGQDQQLRRLLVEQLLSDQFGPVLTNEPRFQQVVDQVSEIMSSDPSISDLLSQVTAELRSRGI